VRVMRREAQGLAREALELLDDLGSTVRRAGMEVDRVDRMVGSAEAISDAVGSASKLVGVAMAGPLIKLLALGSGLARAARLVRKGPPAARGSGGPAKDGRRRPRPKGRAAARAAARPGGRGRSSLKAS
jgi:hypothetical protein